MFDQYATSQKPYATSKNPYAAPESATQESDTFGTILSVLFSFEGRISRSAYWGAYMGTMLILAVVYFAAILISEQLFQVVIALSLIPAIWIGLATEIKRWHDQGKSGFWFFLGLIPYIGGLIKLVMLGFLPGDDGPNDYGDAPIA